MGMNDLCLHRITFPQHLIQLLGRFFLQLRIGGWKIIRPLRRKIIVIETGLQIETGSSDNDRKMRPRRNVIDRRPRLFLKVIDAVGFIGTQKGKQMMLHSLHLSFLDLS